jgi:hypothetical protein
MLVESKIALILLRQINAAYAVHTSPSGKSLATQNSLRFPPKKGGREDTNGEIFTPVV